MSCLRRTPNLAAEWSQAAGVECVFKRPFTTDELGLACRERTISAQAGSSSDEDDTFLGRGPLLCRGFLHTIRRRAAPRIDAKRCDNRQTVLDFYQLSLIELQPRRAFERFASADFVEHAPDVSQGNREATATFPEALIASMPKPGWEIIRTIAEGDMVFLHARFSPADGAPKYAIADVFRLETCLIAEHWDVVAGPPDSQANPNTASDASAPVDVHLWAKEFQNLACAA